MCTLWILQYAKVTLVMLSNEGCYFMCFYAAGEKFGYNFIIFYFCNRIFSLVFGTNKEFGNGESASW